MTFYENRRDFGEIFEILEIHLSPDPTSFILTYLPFICFCLYNINCFCFFHLKGTGTLVGAVETCSQRKAQIIGKPSTLMFSALAKEHNIDPKRAIMIGDR